MCIIPCYVIHCLLPVHARLAHRVGGQLVVQHVEPVVQRHQALQAHGQVQHGAVVEDVVGVVVQQNYNIHSDNCAYNVSE